MKTKPTAEALTLNALAEMTGLGRMALAQRLKGLPTGEIVNGGATYRLADVVQRLVETGRGGEAAAKERKLSAEAELAELELAERQGDLVKVSVIEKVVADDYTACRSRLLSIPTKLAPILAATKNRAEAQRLLERAINEALNELSRGDNQRKPAEKAARKNTRNGAQAAAEADGERVG